MARIDRIYMLWRLSRRCYTLKYYGTAETIIDTKYCFYNFHKIPKMVETIGKTLNE